MWKEPRAWTATSPWVFETLRTLEQQAGTLGSHFFFFFAKMRRTDVDLDHTQGFSVNAIVHIFIFCLRVCVRVFLNIGVVVNSVVFFYLSFLCLGMFVSIVFS